MKKFKYPLAIEGTEDELHALIPELIRLGYRAWNSESWLNDWGKGWVLVTDYCKVNGHLGFSGKAKYNPEREIVQASNPELVLALAAAMVDDNHFHAGELCYWNGQEPTFLTLTEINKNWADDDYYYYWKSNLPTHNMLNHQHLRKATKEEIINHFKQSTMEKKIKGYILIKDLPFAKAGVLYTEENQRKGYYNYNGGIAANALYVDTIKHTDWFAPIYEESEFTAKKGEWVVPIEFGCYGNRSNELSIGKAYELSQDLTSSFCYIKRDNNGKKFLINSYTIKFRYATLGEIAKAKEGETKIITIMSEGSGTFEVEVSKKGIYYAMDNAWIHPNELRTFLNMMKGNRIGKYLFVPLVEYVNCGCLKSVRISDLEKVLHAFDEINGSQTSSQYFKSLYPKLI